MLSGWLLWDDVLRFNITLQNFLSNISTSAMECRIYVFIVISVLIVVTRE